MVNAIARTNPTLQSKKAIVVENKPGAATNLGADFVAKAAPDGAARRCRDLCRQSWAFGGLFIPANSRGPFTDLRHRPEDIEDDVLLDVALASSARNPCTSPLPFFRRERSRSLSHRRLAQGRCR
jgi:hypothetical protein